MQDKHSQQRHTVRRDSKQTRQTPRGDARQQHRDADVEAVADADANRYQTRLNLESFRADSGQT